MKNQVKQKSQNSILLLFFTMLKIGVFTFGGGYAMIALLESEFVSKRKWLSKEEFLDMVAIAESSPGPIAINSATYIGYKVGKFWGSLLATIGVCLPSFIIIFIISLFLNAFLKLTFVAYAFKGIQVGVTFLILRAGLKMLKDIKKDIISILILSLTFGCMIAFALLAVDFSSIFYILIGGFVGLLLYLIRYAIVMSRINKLIIPLQEIEKIDCRQDIDYANIANENLNESIAFEKFYQQFSASKLKTINSDKNTSTIKEEGGNV